MAGVRNLTQIEAAERARILDVTSYDITLDLTDGTGGPGDGTFRSITTVEFTCNEPGATTFVESAMGKIRSATLNGTPLDTSGWSAETGLTLANLAATNTLVVDADSLYSTTGQGLHRSLDPVDKEVYLYSQFETADAQKAFTCFDQPDLKSVYTWHVTAPAHWTIVSNSPVERTEAGDVEGTTTTHFEQSVRMTTYVTALCAGPYHEVRKVHDGIDLGVYCRQSMKQYLDSDDIFLITEQGFDFFHEQFGVRYPLPKYDQLYVPEFNAGAMENFGCVVHGEQYYIFRSAVTDFEYENRANTILHEMAHMWFGDLVTMRWWDDLWLNESFAEWASHWANAHATRFRTPGPRSCPCARTGATGRTSCPRPTRSTATCRTWKRSRSTSTASRTPRAPASSSSSSRTWASTRSWPVCGPTSRSTPGATPPSTTCSPRWKPRPARSCASSPLSGWRPHRSTRCVRNSAWPPMARYASVAVTQEAPTAYPTLRTHRLGVGLYDLAGGKLVRRETVEVTVSGERTELSELAGKPAADVLLLNDEDLTYAKIRLDDRSMATIVEHIGDFDNVARPRPGAGRRRGTWFATPSCRPATTWRWSATDCRPRTDVNLVMATLLQASLATNNYADPAWIPTGLATLLATAKQALAAAEPASGLQLAWARALVRTTRSPADVDVLKGWLAGEGVPDGLAIDTEFRWAILQSVVANGGAGEAEISAELDNDRTATGERQAAIATALIPTAESKAETWRRLTEGDALPNWLQRALLGGFQHPAQVELTKPYVEKYFDVIEQVWATRDSEPAQEIAEEAYPILQIEDATVRATDAWLAGSGTAGAAAPPGRRGPRRYRACTRGSGSGRRRGISGTTRNWGRPSRPPPVLFSSVAQDLPACSASWAKPETMPPARSPPLKAADIDSAASFAARSGMRRRAWSPVTISRAR